MTVLQSFKDFAIKGTMVDMAIGTVIGGAFGKIITTLVDKIIIPPLSILVNADKFDQLSIVLRAKTASSPEIVIAYGQFLQTIADFAIITISIFVVVNMLTKLKVQASVHRTPEEEVLIEIRNLLKRMNKDD